MIILHLLLLSVYFMPIFCNNMKRSYKHSETQFSSGVFQLTKSKLSELNKIVLKTILFNSLTFVFGLDHILEKSLHYILYLVHVLHIRSFYTYAHSQNMSAH